MFADETISFKPGITLTSVTSNHVDATGVVVAVVLASLAFVRVCANRLFTGIEMLVSRIANAPERVVFHDARAVLCALRPAFFARVEIWKEDYEI